MILMFQNEGEVLAFVDSATLEEIRIHIKNLFEKRIGVETVRTDWRLFTLFQKQELDNVPFNYCLRNQYAAEVLDIVGV